MFYELWDVRTSNIVNTYDSEAEALMVVRELLAQNGRDYARDLSLLFEDDQEHTSLIAKGQALAQRAQPLKDAV